MQLLLALSGNVLTAEPFLSFATLWISHINCEGSIAIGELEPKPGMHVVKLDSLAQERCYVRDTCRWAAARLAVLEDTCWCSL